MTSRVFPCYKCGEQNWVHQINGEGLCRRCANINRFRCGVWYAILTGVALVGLALFLNSHTHAGHCKPSPEGTVCKIEWGKR